MRKFIIGLALTAITATAMPVLADPPPWAPAYGRRAQERSLYDSYGRYYEPRHLSRSERIWRGRDGRYYCKRDNGTTGLIIGAAAGALLGRELSRGQDATVGMIIGATGGALVGRAIDRGDIRCR